MTDSVFSTLQNRLIKDEELNLVISAIMTADILNHYEENIKNAIIDWASGKDVSEVEIDGNSVKDIMEEVNCSPFQALCILNGIHSKEDTFVDAVLVEWKDNIL